MLLQRILGFPFALIYGLVVHIRNYFYDLGLLKSKTFDTPTICVGNLSLGGTGKTPMVEFLVAALKDKLKVAVLSRGYRRKSTGFVLANSKSTVEDLGDEPFQIHKKFENLILAVDAKRSNGIRELERQLAPDLIILDDAYQHRKVSPAFSILLTSYDKLYTNDFFFPSGTLRDSRNQAKRANVIVVTKCPINLSNEEKIKIEKKLSPLKNQKVLFAYLEYAEELKGYGESIKLDFLNENKFTLVTGIANPKPMVEFLKNMDLQFEHLRYKDHHAFSKTEIDKLNTKSFVLTTEKDFTRLKAKVERLAYIEIRHKFMGEGKNELLLEIEKITKLSW